MVERHVANVAVVGSSPITRSGLKRHQPLATGLNSLMYQGLEAVSVYDFGKHVLVLLLTSPCSCVLFILVV